MLKKKLLKIEKAKQDVEFNEKIEYLIRLLRFLADKKETQNELNKLENPIDLPLFDLPIVESNETITDNSQIIESANDNTEQIIAPDIEKSLIEAPVQAEFIEGIEFKIPKQSELFSDFIAKEILVSSIIPGEKEDELNRRRKANAKIRYHILKYFVTFWSFLLLFLLLYSAKIIIEPHTKIYQQHAYVYDADNYVHYQASYFDTTTKSFPSINDYASKSVLVFSLESNQPIFEKNTENPTLIASLTKLLSTKILYDNIDLNGETIINDEVDKITGSALVLKKDNKFKNIDLLKAAIVASSNQSVYALNKPEDTVTRMNDFTKVLMLKGSNFSNPAGFDDRGENYSTAEDLVTIAKVFFQNPELKKFAGMPKTEIHELTDDKKIKINNTNDLLRLGNANVIAGKTGTTQSAGENLILLAQKNRKNYIIVLLNGTERYIDAQKILDRL